jgi:hypothetical protein
MWLMSMYEFQRVKNVVAAPAEQIERVVPE